MTESIPSTNTNLKNDDTLIKVDDLVTYFYTEEGVVKAVDGVSFSIKEDEIMGLVGETGCGKSVTALSILQLIRYPGKIVSGEIIFKNENGERIDLTKLTQEEIRHYRGNQITMIFQDPTNSLNPVMTAGYQISEVFMLHQLEDMQEVVAQRNQKIDSLKAELKELKAEQKETTDQNRLSEIEDRIKEIKAKRLKKFKVDHIARERSREMLEFVGIPDPEGILDRYPHELSGGMKQRVMIAMGLACNSKLLICDEPTTALDVTIQAQILELIRELKRKLHNSVLFITHDLGVIYELCDKVAVMYAGKIIEYGTVDQIFENPQHPYSQGLLKAIPRVNREDRDRRLAVIPGMVPNLIFDLPGCRFHPRCPHAMEICQKIRPSLKDHQGTGVQVSCHLYDEQLKAEDPDKFKKITKEQKKRYDL